MAIGEGRSAFNLAGGLLATLWEASNHNSCPECLQGVVPDITPGGGGKIIFSGTKVTGSLAKRLGIARRDLGKRIEAIKKAWGRGGADNIRIDEFGNVLGRESDEIIGNVFDELPRK